MSDLIRIASDLRSLADELDGSDVVEPEPTSRLVVAIRENPLFIRGGRWTPVPMDKFYGGAEDLFTGEYILGASGYWDHAAYIKFSPNDEGQGIVRFVRDIGGEHDFTGAEDWVTTPGRDFKSHTWPFQPIVGKPTGFEVYSSKDVTVEYAQLKAAAYWR